ncbi:MAG TPA: hypothetical protein VFD70_06230 [Anaerolineae bacterium]|nr:hypothetical protein [Anaerolineae bacterium]
MPARRDILLVFAACVVPVFAWALLSYLDAFPGFILRMSIWDLLGSISYVLAIALIESIIFLIPILLSAILLPPRFLKNHFVSIGSLVVLITAAWLMYANRERAYLGTWDTLHLVIVLVLYALSLAIPIALVIHSKRLEQIIQAAMERVAVLAYIYVAFAFVGLIIVVIRNV